MKTKKLKLLTILLLLLPLCMTMLGAGCEKEDSISACGVDDPLINLNWLRDLKNDLKDDNSVTSSEIILYRLNDVDYIYVQKSVNSAYDFPNTIYDCKGNEEYKCGGNQPINNCTTFFSEAQKIKTLWEKK
ncbi:MAG: hypothetical protein L3J11_04585 [Draconibacterium sp.]|nr:hypothetical protein [Draconibacterium sp.]